MVHGKTRTRMDDKIAIKGKTSKKNHTTSFTQVQKHVFTVHINFMQIRTFGGFWKTHKLQY
jgi:hypothetical protein